MVREESIKNIVLRIVRAERGKSESKNNYSRVQVVLAFACSTLLCTRLKICCFKTVRCELMSLFCLI